MRFAKILTGLGVCIMAGVIFYAFLVGDFRQEGHLLLSMPWGIVSLVDLYTGFFLFSGWIIFRERSVFHAVMWIIAMMLLGFFAGSLYTFIALQKSEGNWKQFWLGSRWREEYFL
jgi:hypothetical protein